MQMGKRGNLGRKGMQAAQVLWGSLALLARKEIQESRVLMEGRGWLGNEVSLVARETKGNQECQA